MRRAGLAILLSLSAAALRAGTPQADLRVTITDERTRALPGETLTYEIQAYNAGPDAAPASSVSTELVPSFTATGWTCNAFSGAACSAPSGTGPLLTTVDLPAAGLVVF